MTDWIGLLNLNKPAGCSSRQAVDHVKPVVKPCKIGHAGTLDPLASGVLILCIGPATRLVPYLHKLRKTYRAEFLFGCTSPTDDTESEVERIPNAPTLTREDIDSVLPQFVGRIEQVPPAYSAVKVGGRRAYDLARRGRAPSLAPRRVEVDSVRILAFDGPRIELEIACGPGTYIRSIGRDLGRSLGSGAVMSRLTRTSVGPFTLEDAVLPGDVTQATLTRHLQSPQSGLIELSQLMATDAMLERLQRGLRCPCPGGVDAKDDEEVAVLDSAGQLVLIAVVARSGRELQPRHVFVSGSARR